MTEARFLKLAGGWLNPDAIRWAEERDNGLAVSIAGKEHPIFVQDEDAKIVRRCLEMRAFVLPSLEDQDEAT